MGSAEINENDFFLKCFKDLPELSSDDCSPSVDKVECSNSSAAPPPLAESSKCQEFLILNKEITRRLLHCRFLLCLLRQLLKCLAQRVRLAAVNISRSDA